MPVVNKIVLFIITFTTTFTFSQSSKQSSPISPDEKEYLRNFIYPLQSYEPEIGFKEDSLVFNKFFSNSQIIGLGEASHGSAEIFKIKDKLTRYILQKNKGCIFSIEAPMADSNLVNDYIIEGKRSGKIYVMNLKSRIYSSEEILAMVEWMKIFNENTTEKLRFTGFDITYFKTTVTFLKILMDKYKIPIGTLASLSKNLTDFSNLRRNQLSEKKNLRDEGLININNLKNLSVDISDAEDKSWFLQYLTLLDQFMDHDDRNRYMAENVIWLKNKYPESAFVLWAHNEHIKKTDEETGKFLKEKYGENYVNVGTFFYKGTHTLADLKDNEMKSIYLEKNPKESLEELLNSFDIPIFILDMKTIKKENNKLGKSILSKINYRTVGAAEHRKDYKSGIVSDDFDYLIFVKNSTASKLLTN